MTPTGAAPTGAARSYLDHASTSPLRPQAAHAIRGWLDTQVGDPARVHREGKVVRAAIEDARDQVAGLLGVRPRQVVFTSGATEAVNAAVFSATQARPGNPVLVAPVEHSAVRDASRRAAPVLDLPVDRHGRIRADEAAHIVASSSDPVPALVHCQWANHEVGTLQPVAGVATAHDSGAPVHVDAAAAFGQLPLDLGTLGADYVSISAHTMGGPPGIGALVLRRGLRPDPLIVGGQQERARRAGGENVLGIIGFGAAAAALDVAALAAEQAAARGHIAALLAAATHVSGVTLVGDPDPAGRLPNLVCLGVDGVEAEPVLLGLDRAGVAAHSGSACASEGLEPSPVLEAMGVDPSRSLRLSVGWSTTASDVDAFRQAFGPVVGQLRALS